MRGRFGRTGTGSTRQRRAKAKRGQRSRIAAPRPSRSHLSGENRLTARSVSCSAVQKRDGAEFGFFFSFQRSNSRWEATHSFREGGGWEAGAAPDPGTGTSQLEERCTRGRRNRLFLRKQNTLLGEKKRRREEEKTNHRTPFARREIVHGAERPRGRGEPVRPRGLPVIPSRFTEPSNKAKSQRRVAPRERKHQTQSKYWLGQIPNSPKGHKNLQTQQRNPPPPTLPPCLRDTSLRRLKARTSHCTLSKLGNKTATRCAEPHIAKIKKKKSPIEARVC